jgi:DNA polymerase-3 subunit delta
MTGTVHVFDFLANPPQEMQGGICALFGGERFLKLLAINNLLQSLLGEDAEFGANHFDGDSVNWPDVLDELSTLSLFGGDGPRIVVLNNADGFVKKFRDRLEGYVKSPPANGLLLLDVGTWPSNTKLYKAIEKSALQIQCDAPVVKRGRGKQRDDKRTAQWLVGWAQSQYGFELPVSGAHTVIELTDCEFGRMDQELAKLSLYADGKTKIDQKLINQVVGGWRTETMWSAIDAATEGDAGKALQLLDQLLMSDEHPLALFGQLSWSLRRYAETAEIVSRQQRNGRRIDLDGAMKQAGFNAWGGELENGARRLRQLGRERAFQMHRWLVDADLALKRSHARPERGRLVLETLFVKMAKELGATNA